MTVDPREREFLAQFLGVTVVRLDVDRAFEEERFVETVELFLAFSYLREIRTENEGLVDLTGIEPVTS